MIRTIFLLIIAIQTVNVSAQTFEKFYISNMDDIVYDACYCGDSKIIFVVNSKNQNTNEYHLKMFTMDIVSGEFIDSTEVLSSSTDYSLSSINKVSLISDASVLALGQAQNNSTGKNQLFIGIFDLNLIEIFDTIVGNLNYEDGFLDHLILEEKIISVGLRDLGSGNETSPLVYITDLFGHFIKEKVYPNHGLLGSTIIDIPNTNNYHLYRFWDTDHSFNIIDDNTLEVDTIIEYPLGYLPRNTVYGIDSSYYYVAGRQYDLYPGTLGDFLSFLKVSNNGQLVQQYNFEIDDEITYYTNNSFSHNNNNIFMAGTYPCTWDPPLFFYPEQRYILINKIDNNGNLIWQKFYKGEVHYMAYKVLATDDGGAIIFSTKYDWNDPIPNQRDVHILKIDSAGYYTPLTGTNEDFEQMEKQILVYPNPVDDEVNFVFGLYNNLAITIFDLSGKQVFSKEFKHSPVIDLSFLKPGIYPYAITGKNGFLEEGKLVKK